MTWIYLLKNNDDGIFAEEQCTHTTGKLFYLCGFDRLKGFNIVL